MTCLCRRQPKSHGHVLVVNSPHGVSKEKVYLAMEKHAPVKVISPNTAYLPGVDAHPELPGSLAMTDALAKSATYLAQQGQVPVINLEDPSHSHLVQAANVLTDIGLPITSVLFYVPLEQIVQSSSHSVPQLLNSLQDFAHMYRGSFESTVDTLDVLTRDQFEKLFRDLKATANEDDKMSLAIVQRFLSSTLGLNVRPEVYLEPRANAYDKVFNLGEEHKALAQDIVTELRNAVGSNRLSALGRMAQMDRPFIPVCPTCQQHMTKDASSSPNGRVRCSLPVCGPCLSLSRRWLLGIDLPATRPFHTQTLVPGPKSSGVLGAHQLGAGTNSAVPLKGTWRDNLRYNEVFQKSSKNSNARSESLMDQLVYHRIRSLEFDLHAYKGSFLWSQQAPARDWWLTHGTISGFYESHQLDRLSDALGRLKAFHDMFPEHEVITLFLNINDSFGKVPQKGHRPEDLDALLGRHLGELIYKPKDLKGSASSLQAAAKNGWPLLKNLVGKFIPVVVTGAQAYADAQDLAEKMQCFVAKSNISHPEHIHRHNWAVFFDLNSSNDLLAKEIDKAGFVSRQWVESQYAYQQAIRKRAHHLTTKSINYHHNTWSKTHTSRGFPFLPFANGIYGFDSAVAEEPAHMLSLRASTGQLWGLQDNGVFASFEDETPDGQWVEYQWMASNANSHMNKWARAGIAFRASKDDESSAYFALVRPAHYSKPPQVQMRSHSDGITTASVARSSAAALLKVRVRYNRGSTDCEGYFSEDGKKWRLIRSTTIPSRLGYHGLIASSHGEAKNMDSTQYRFVYANLIRDGKPLFKAHFPYLTELGMVYRTARLADGFDDDMLDMDLDMDIDMDLGYDNNW